MAIAALTTVSLGLLASSFVASNIADKEVRDAEFAQSQQLNAISLQVSEKVTRYYQILIAGSALFDVKNDTSKDEWATFTKKVSSNTSSLNVVGIGYAKLLPPDQVGDYVEKMKSEVSSDYAIRPLDPPRTIYSAITFLEPDTAINHATLGYDMYSEPTRQAAMNAARDSAKMIASQPVQLVQDIARNRYDLRGVLLYYPVYNDASIPTTVGKRRETINAFTYMVIRPDEIMRGIVEKESGKIAVLLKDVTPDMKTPITLYNSQPDDSIFLEPHASRKLAIGGRTWQMSLVSTEPGKHAQWGAKGTFILGALMSILAGWTVYSYLLRRVNLLKDTYDLKIRDTKNELLSLTSHQLRTPASAVKQYVGMLTQGFAGELNEEQLSIADKAYAANNRQLEIIDQLLYVAKADAGQISLAIDELDLRSKAERTIQHLADNAAKKNITLTISGRKKLTAYGDKRFVAMIVENLISNAIKYSYDGSTVSIKIFNDKDFACMAVSDHGVGISEEEQEAIYDKFTRLDNPLSRSEGGNGLGLFLAKRLTEAHHGELELKSKEGKGSTFTLKLPKNAPENLTEKFQLTSYSGK